MFESMDLVIHQHGDHLDLNARVTNNGDKATILGVGIEVYPAYNIVHKRANGQPYHPKGEGNA